MSITITRRNLIIYTGGLYKYEKYYDIKSTINDTISFTTDSDYIITYNGSNNIINLTSNITTTVTCRASIDTNSANSVFFIEFINGSGFKYTDTLNATVLCKTRPNGVTKYVDTDPNNGINGPAYDPLNGFYMIVTHPEQILGTSTGYIPNQAYNDTLVRSRIITTRLTSFRNMTGLNPDPNWDVSNVTNFNNLFNGNYSDLDFSKWDVSNAITMNQMFANSYVTSDLSSWDVSNATDMSNMFYGSSITLDLSSWNVFIVTDMSNMFSNTQLGPVNLNSWVLSSVIDMSNMFSNSSLSISLNNWNPLNVKNMNSMFSNNGTFTSNISGWDVSSVTDMSYMFLQATNFSQNLNTWNVSSVTNMNSMFDSASSFNSPINSWNVSNVTNMNSMFKAAGSFDKPLNNWNVSNVTDMSYMFHQAYSFNQDLGSWNVSNVTNMSNMFNEVQNFNYNLNSWNTSKVTNMNNMFYFCTYFNQPLNLWNTSKVTNMNNMFGQCTYFNQPINTVLNIDPTLDRWNMENVEDMENMFENARNFNQSLNQWVFPKVTSLANLFKFAILFNGNISSWNVSNITNMSFLFAYADVFNSNISSWNVSRVTDMNNMFNSAVLFNQNLSTWDVSSVYYMDNMFNTAWNFNSDISDWDVSSVISFDSMFVNAANLDQNLTKWDFSVKSGVTLPSSYLNNVFNNCPSKNLDFRSLNMINISNPGNFIIDPDFPQFAPLWNTNGTLTTGGPIGNSHISYELFNTGSNISVKVKLSIPGITEGGTFTITPNSFFTGENNINTGTFTTGILEIILVPTTNVTGSGSSSIINIFMNFNTLPSVTLTAKINNPSLVTLHTNGVTAMAPISGGIPTICYRSDNNNFYLSIKKYNSDFLFNNDRNKYNLKYFLLNNTFTDNLITTNVKTFKNLINTQPNMNLSAFNSEISSWDTSNVTNMNNTFSQANLFNKDISKWDTSKVTNMNNMFFETFNFNQEIGDWNTSKVTNMSLMFYRANVFDKSIGNWNVSNVTNMSSMFTQAFAFNKDIGNWNVSNVTGNGMFSMFNRATNFNQNINSWNVSKATNFSSLFSEATAFNSPLNSWNVSNVTNMNSTFNKATNFNEDIGNWNVSKVTDFRNMFKLATSFNKQLKTNVIPSIAWNVSSGIYMDNMFNQATSFNQEIGLWITSKVIDMNNMFNQATSFNQAIDNWDVSKVTNMSNMFKQATSFNQDIGDWEVTKVTNMNEFLRNATSFNHKFDGWKNYIHYLATMTHFLNNATSFNKDLSLWNLYHYQTRPLLFDDNTSATYLLNTNLHPVWGRLGVSIPSSSGPYTITFPKIRPNNTLNTTDTTFSNTNILQNINFLSSTIISVTINTLSITPNGSNILFNITSMSGNERGFSISTSDSFGIDIESDYSFEVLVETTLGNVIQVVNFTVDNTPTYDSTGIITIPLGTISSSSSFISSNAVISDSTNGLNLNGETINTISFSLYTSANVLVTGHGLFINVTTGKLEIPINGLPVGNYYIKDVIVTDTDGDYITISTPNPYITFNYTSGSVSAPTSSGLYIIPIKSETSVTIGQSYTLLNIDILQNVIFGSIVPSEITSVAINSTQPSNMLITFTDPTPTSLTRNIVISTASDVEITDQGIFNFDVLVSTVHGNVIQALRLEIDNTISFNTSNFATYFLGNVYQGILYTSQVLTDGTNGVNFNGETISSIAFSLLDENDNIVSFTISDIFINNSGLLTIPANSSLSLGDYKIPSLNIQEADTDTPSINPFPSNYIIFSYIVQPAALPSLIDPLTEILFRLTLNNAVVGTNNTFISSGQFSINNTYIDTIINTNSFNLIEKNIQIVNKVNLVNLINFSNVTNYNQIVNDIINIQTISLVGDNIIITDTEVGNYIVVVILKFSNGTIIHEIPIAMSLTISYSDSTVNAISINTNGFTADVTTNPTPILLVNLAVLVAYGANIYETIKDIFESNPSFLALSETRKNLALAKLGNYIPKLEEIINTVDLNDVEIRITSDFNISTTN